MLSRPVVLLTEPVEPVLQPELAAQEGPGSGQTHVGIDLEGLG